MTDFSETQGFSPRLLAFLLASGGAAGLAGILLARQDPDAGLGFAIIIAALGATYFLFRALKMTTEVGPDGVVVRGLIFVNRLIRFDEIAAAEPRTYRPLMEYGGWGYRIGPAGKAYNPSGNEGVQLTLTDGGRVLIGSGRASELARAINARLGRRG